MKDIDKLKNLFKEFGIPKFDDQYEEFDSDTEVVLYAQDNADGYYGFYTVFKFDKEGKFKSVGIWE